MRGAEGVVFAFRAFGEAVEPILLTDGANAVAARGEDLVGIGLMADIPDQAIARRVEHIMQCDSELDDTEPGAEMPAYSGNRIDRLRTKLVSEGLKLPERERTQLRRLGHLIQQWRLNWHRSRPFPLAYRCGTLSKFPLIAAAIAPLAWLTSCAGLSLFGSDVSG